MSGERGLLPFDDPVYLEHAAAGAAPIEVPTDERPRPVLAFLCRSCLLVALAASLPFLTDGDLRVTVTIVLSLHIPATTALDMARASAERSRQTISHILTALDVLALAGLAVAAEQGIVLTTLGPLLIAFHRWMYGRRAAAASVVLTVAALTAIAVSGIDDIDWFSVAAVATVGSLLVWLVDDQATRHSQASAGLHLVATRAEAVIEGIGDAIVSTDRAGRIVGVNPAAAHLLGRSTDEVRGSACHVRLGFETDAGPLDCSKGCALLDQDGRSIEVRRHGADGHRQPLLASAVALRDHDGAVVEVVHLLRDITTLKHADDAKTLFLATASHELKTPLTVISGYAQILTLPGLDDTDKIEAVDAIRSRSSQLVNIVDRLLMSSRIDGGRLDLSLRPIPIVDLLRDHATAFTAASRAVDLSIDGDLPRALADHAALETVVDHLLENADKYSPDHGAVTIRAHADDAYVSIDVSDHGIGMTPAQMDLCFERFWQAEGTDVRRFGGTGIGLYIVESLVRAMHGDVDVRANEGAGVTFTVRLRRHPVDDLELDLVDRSPDPSGGEKSMIREFMRQMGVLSESGDPS